MKYAAISLLLISALVCPAEVHAQGKKHAFLVGINQYHHGNLPNLRVAEKDVSDLAAVLQLQQYDVTQLLGEQATKKVIEEKLAATIDKFAVGDTLILFLAGHGLQFEGMDDGFFCPVDGKPFANQSQTLISLKSIYDTVNQAHRGAKIVIVDACRNDPNAARSAKVRARSGGLDSGVNLNPPNGVAALFSCSPGQQSFEGDGNGFFTQAILESLRDGKNADSSNRITWHRMLEYVKIRTEELAKLADHHQVPDERVIGLTGSPVIAMVAPAGNNPIAPSTKSRVKTLGDMRDVKRRMEVSGKNSNPSSDLPASVKSKTCEMEFVLIEAGEFMMGSPETDKDAQADEKPQRKVQITKPFYLGKYEVTQAEWKAVMGTEPWILKKYAAEGIYHAACSISQKDALAFAKRLSERDGVTYRLPTEAEWEYACRGRTNTRWYFGDDDSLLNDHAWWGGAEGEGTCKMEQYAHPVGWKRPNNFGLYDMHGNVYEWCSDGNDESLYKNAPAVDPENTLVAEAAYLRGGAWYTSKKDTRSASRIRRITTYHNDYTGFRLLRIP